ncbi:MFS transporter [Rhodococcus pyridinivorans]
MSRQASRGASVHLPERTRTPDGRALVALDSAGAGMYLPVAALFLIQVRGFSVADAGLALGIGAGVGLLFPVLAGTLVDRVGPRRVIGTGQLLRAIAMLVYLLVPGWPGAIAGSAICAAGMQLHYGSLYAFLTALRPSDGSHDAQFARVEMVRSAG